MIRRAHTSDLSHPNPGLFAMRSRGLDASTCVLAVEGELDLASAPALKGELLELLRGGYGKIVLDLSRVTFMDSTALGVLVGIDRRLDEGERLAIACPQPEVLNIFELAGLDGTFHLESNVEDALTRVREAPSAD